MVPACHLQMLQMSDLTDGKVEAEEDPLPVMEAWDPNLRLLNSRFQAQIFNHPFELSY